MSKQLETEVPKDNELNNLDQENEEDSEDINAENDPEILKKVQNLKIDENMFKDTTTNNKKQQKSKNQGKNNKKNGVDFLEYAKEHKIDMNIKYEKSPPKKDVQVQDKKNFNKTNNSQTNYKTGFNKNNTKYNNNNNNKKHGNNNDQSKLFNNKFDPINGFNNNPYMMYNYPMMRPDMMMQGGYNYMNSGFGGYGLGGYNPNFQTYQNLNSNQLQNHDDHLNGKGVKESLEYYLSVDNLNKDIYLRKQIDEEGFVDVNVILNFNNMKRHNANLSSVKEVLSDKECSLEDKTVGEKLFIRNKNWSNLKSTLLSLEEIEQQKNIKKNYNYNFVTMQNNYYMMDPNMMQGMGNSYPNYGNSGFKQN